MKRTLITGGTGLVGSRLSEQLEHVLITTRNPAKAREQLGDHVETIQWNPTAELVTLHKHEPIDAVVNLMGESIASERWTKDKKQRIVDSRIKGTSHLVRSIEQMANKPKVLVSASAVGYYGDHGDQVITEASKPGTGFLSNTCQQWEDAPQPLEEMGIRLVIVRIGIVMAREGGALSEMLPIFQKGMGGRLGDGNQYFPWIHIDDLVAVIVWAIQNESVRGIYNAVAPNPVTNDEFTRQLATELKRPAFLPVPRFALRMAIGEFADSLFQSQRVIPQAASRDGFEFKFPKLAQCLHDLLG